MSVFQHREAQHEEADGPSGKETTSAIEVSVDAEPSQLSVMRAVVGDLAMRADFDVDAIADLRLAVDEVCSTLIQLAGADTRLTCRFHREDAGLSIEAEVLSAERAAPRTDTFSWRVLRALTDTVSTAVEPDTNGTDQQLVRIQLTKRRVVHG
jgi:serine/threonine-protein kinase RsbW